MPAQPGLTCYPNPFNDRAIIGYSLPEGGPVRLAVYNVLGQEILELERDHRQAGAHQAAWDGRDAAGSEVASGLYFCRLETVAAARTVKMVLVK